MDRGDWWATVDGVAEEWDMTYRLNNNHNNYASQVTKFQTLGADFEGARDSVSPWQCKNQWKECFQLMLCCFQRPMKSRENVNRKENYYTFVPLKLTCPSPASQYLWDLLSPLEGVGCLTPITLQKLARCHLTQHQAISHHGPLPHLLFYHPLDKLSRPEKLRSKQNIISSLLPPLRTTFLFCLFQLQ